MHSGKILLEKKIKIRLYKRFNLIKIVYFHSYWIFGKSFNKYVQDGIQNVKDSFQNLKAWFDDIDATSKRLNAYGDKCRALTGLKQK